MSYDHTLHIYLISNGSITEENAINVVNKTVKLDLTIIVISNTSFKKNNPGKWN